jgi:hypothetical protein
MGDLIITRKLLMSDRLVVTPSYVSNGYWAIKKSLCQNAKLLETEDLARIYFPWLDGYIEKTDEEVESLKPEKMIRYVRSEWLHCPNINTRRYSDLELTILFKKDSEVEGEPFIKFNLEWIKALNIYCLYGDWNEQIRKPFISNDENFYIMPLINNWEEEPFFDY